MGAEPGCGRRAGEPGWRARDEGPRTDGELSAAAEQERAPRPRVPAAPHINTRAPETRANARPRALPSSRKHTPSPTSPRVSHLLCARSPKHTPSCKHGPRTHDRSRHTARLPRLTPPSTHASPLAPKARASHTQSSNVLAQATALPPFAPETRPHNTRSPCTLQASLAT